MRGIKLIITLLSLLVATTATAMTDSYLQAVKMAQKGDYIEAASLFSTQLAGFKDNPTYINRTQIWLALTLLANDDQSTEAEKILQTVLCTSSATKSHIEKAKECPLGHTWSPTTQIDTDMVSAAVAAYASIKWRRGEYKTSIQFLNLALQYALEAKPTDDDITPALKQLDATPSTHPVEIIKKEQHRQELLKEQLMTQMMNKLATRQGKLDDGTLAIDSETQQALASSVISEMFAKRMMPNQETAQKAHRDPQSLAKVAASESQTFYRLATSTMCQHLNTGVHSAPTIENMNQSVLESMAAMLEASRGQYVESFEISQRPVLNGLNILLDNKQKLPPKFNLFAQQRGNFLQKLGACPDSLNLEDRFNKALLVALTRPARTHRNEQHLHLLISTAGRLRESKQSSDPFTLIHERMEHQIMANFYLRSRQPVKAIPELQQALDKYKLHNQFSLAPEVSYTFLKMAVRNLQSLVQAYQQSDNNLTELELPLNKLRGDMNTLNAEVAKRLDMTSEQLLALQLEETKQALNESPMLGNMQGMLQNVTAMLPQSEQNSDTPNPLTKFNQILSSLNSGDFDAAILEQAKNLNTQAAMPSQQDVYGSLLERRHQLYNSHAQLLMLFVQIELDLNKHKIARQKMDEAEAYLQTHSGWISERSKAYHQYTRARLLIADNNTTEASKAFAKAVKGWYFTPYSTIETVFSLLKNETEILEHAAAFSINQGATEKALNYIEVARDTNFKSGLLYGVLSDQELVAEEHSLRQQSLILREAAAVRAKEHDQAMEFESALQQALASAQQSHRQKIDPAYNLLTLMESLSPWLDSEGLGQFVDSTLQHIARKQSLSLNQKRIDFLYQQQDMSTPEIAYRPATPHMDNAMTLSTRIQESISDDTLLLSIWVNRDISYVVALDKQDIRAHQQPSLPLLKLVKAFNKSYKHQHGHKLFQTLLAPYLDRPYERIVLVANGPLQNTAFSALSTAPDNQAWLGDHYLLRSLPRAAQMLNSYKLESTSIKALVLDGSSVPGERELAATEINTVFEYFAGDQIANEKLTKQNLMEHLPQYSLAHFAGHSEINHEFPDFSHLALYKDKAYLLELEQLPLDKLRLIVLGSCESAAHAGSSFDNPFSSLHESLLGAGAESVLANLFPVDDQIASELLSRFYELLAQGLAKDSALQQAQQYIRTNNPNPRDWAGFVLSGSEQAL